MLLFSGVLDVLKQSLCKLYIFMPDIHCMCVHLYSAMLSTYFKLYFVVYDGSLVLAIYGYLQVLYLLEFGHIFCADCAFVFKIDFMVL